MMHVHWMQWCKILLSRTEGTSSVAIPIIALAEQCNLLLDCPALCINCLKARDACGYGRCSLSFNSGAHSLVNHTQVLLGLANKGHDRQTGMSTLQIPVFELGL
jgi:hypothetical protein